MMGSMNMMKEAILKGHYPEKEAERAMRAEEGLSSATTTTGERGIEL